MSDAELDALFKELDDFIREYRSGEKVTKPQTEDDRKLITQLNTNMRTYEKYKPTYLEAKENPHLNLVQRNIIKETARVYAEHFRASIDEARGYGLIHENENTLKKSVEENTELRRQLDEARQEIERLRNLVRFLHGNPDRSNDSFTGDVE